MLIGFLTIFRFREKNTWLHFDLVCDLLWNRCTAKWNCSVHNKILWHSTYTKPISGTVERHKIESKSCLVVYLSRIKVNRKNIVGDHICWSKQKIVGIVLIKQYNPARGLWESLITSWEPRVVTSILIRCLNERVAKR